MSDSEFDDYSDSTYEESYDSDDEITAEGLYLQTQNSVRNMWKNRPFMRHISDRLFALAPPDECLPTPIDLTLCSDNDIMYFTAEALDVYNTYMSDPEYQASIVDIETVIMVLKCFGH